MASDPHVSGPAVAGDSAPVALVGAARGTADDEFTAFVVAHQRDLLRTAWLLVGDAHRAEELTQQALVRTYVRWARAREAPLPYARRVLVNLRTDAWRRRRDVPVAALPDDAFPAGSSTVRGTADLQADRDELVRALAVLTARQRRVVVLRHLVGLTEAEVADHLGIGVGTVKSTTSRALGRLRAHLGAPDREPDREPDRDPGEPGDGPRGPRSSR